MRLGANARIRIEFLLAPSPVEGLALRQVCVLPASTLTVVVASLLGAARLGSEEQSLRIEKAGLSLAQRDGLLQLLRHPKITQLLRTGSAALVDSGLAIRLLAQIGKSEPGVGWVWVQIATSQLLRMHYLEKSNYS